MAIRGRRTTVTDTPTLLSATVSRGTVGDPTTMSIRNLGPATVELGGPDVTFGSGYPLMSGEGLDVDLMINEVLWGVCDTGLTAQIAKLMVRQSGV